MSNNKQLFYTLMASLHRFPHPYVDYFYETTFTVYKPWVFPSLAHVNCTSDGCFLKVNQFLCILYYIELKISI